MKLLSAENISMSYGEKVLLKNVSLHLHEGDRIGLIGINGTGKSTLLKIIGSLVEPEEGTIIKANGIRISYLPQNPSFTTKRSVLEQVLYGIDKKERDVKEYEAKSILYKLGITELDKDVTILSGGEKKRVAIASVLVNAWEILIMDEPTNHIDNDMVQWLEQYLVRYSGAILMVTHDRYFLNRISNKIIELDKGNLYSYEANYEKYLELKALREDMEVSSERKRQSLLKRELAWIQRGPRGRGTKSKSRIERFEELQDSGGIETTDKIQFEGMSQRLGKKIISLNNLNKRYEDKVLVEDFSYIILREDRIGIIGKNGSGKSTLLKMILGNVIPETGYIETGETVKIGYFSQEGEEMNTSLKVIDYIKEVAEYIETKEGTFSASQMLERFLFPGELQWNTIAKLSGGERRRLYLLRVLMSSPNVLILDEPTNDLDIQTLMILEEFIEGFDGPVIVVSHDRYFLDKVANKLFAFVGTGEVRVYHGGYTDCYDAILEHMKAIAPQQDEGRKPVSNPVERVRTKKLKFTYNEQREYESIDMDIEALELSLQILEAKIAVEGSNYQRLQELLAEKEGLEAQLEEKTERWVYLNELAEKIEQQN